MTKNFDKRLKAQQLANEQKRRTVILAHVAEEMRKKGASEKSIQTVLKGFYEYLKPTTTSSHSKPSSDLGIGTDPNPPTNPQPTPDTSPETASPGLLLSQVETQQIDWLWPKRLPLGKITILDGDPGMGKSLLAIHLAACISTGQPLPDGSPITQGCVIMIAPEDGAADTIKPRVEAAGGDSSQVLLLNTVESIDAKSIKIYQRPFALSHDLDILEKAINRMQATLVILDPLTALLGDHIDVSRDQNIREVFTPLAQLAEQTNCAILIIRHLNKGSSHNPLYRGAGSIGIIAAARMGLIVAQDPDDEQKRILATTKNNLSKKASNLAYQVIENAHGVPHLQWLGESHHSLADLMSVGTTLSTQRQHILRILKASPTSLSPIDVAERTHQEHNAVRKTLRRMYQSGEIASPSRGLYTTLAHPSLTTHVNENTPVP